MNHTAIVAFKRRMTPGRLSRGRWMPVLLSALALVTAVPAAWAASSTTTSLFTTPDNPSSGAVITMTAQVSSTETTVAGGTVTFVDTYNSVSEVLGTVQVQSSFGAPGTAILETEVGGVGNHQFVATYNGTALLATSASSPQSVTFVAPYLSATALSSTGTPGNLTLTGTVSAFGPANPSGSVTFTDTTSNFVLGTAALNAATLKTGFTSSQNYPIANMNNGQTGGTNGPAIGDFNGDGRPDFAVPTNGGPIVILLGKGDGTFTNGTSLTPAAPFEPTSVVVGDFNGDGKQDIAVLSANGVGSVDIYLGNGDGTFGIPKNYPVAASNSGSRLLAMGDFNQDGIADLVATNSSLNNVAVLLGNGDGSFKTPAYYNVGAAPWNVVVGDLNKDGILDLAVAADGSASATILQGNGDGTFKAYITANTGAQQVGSVAIGDFNGDGYLDLATTSAPDNAVYILLNKGTATPSFQAPVKYTMNSGPYYLTIGDFNRDGKVDIISANNGNTTVGILYGTGTGTFTTPATYFTVDGGAIFAAEGDINGDDQVDLTAVTGNGLSVLLSGESESASINNIAIFGCGNQSVTATYSGDGNYGSSTSPATAFSPGKDATALALIVNPANGAVGQQVTMQATLSPSAYGSTTTNGEKVTFKNNGTVVGTATLNSGVAVLNVTLPFGGTDFFQATYGGDCTFNSSSSNIVFGSTLLSSTLKWNTPAPIAYGVPLSGTQLNAVDTVGGVTQSGTYTYTPAAGTILQAGTQTLSVTFTPNNVLYAQETATVQITVTQGQTVITWPTPTPITYGTPLSGFQLDATVSSGTVSVPLSGLYNVYGIYTQGSVYNAPPLGPTTGFDNDGYSYSTTTLGSTLVWNGLTFNIGPANALDAVSNITIPLPQGKYTNLYMLGAMVNNIAPAQTFIVTYTDNTTTTLNQNMSDWFNAAGWPGESVIDCSEKRNYSNGTTQADSVCVYGYQIVLDPTKTVKSVQLPGTRNIVMLAMDLTTPSIPGTFVYNPPAGTIEPVGTGTQNPLSVTFTPTDTTDYTSSSATVYLTVTNPITALTPTISWPKPANITYGTLLSSTQLDAVAMATANPTPVVPTSQVKVLSTSTDGTPYALAGFDNAGSTFSYNQLNNGSVNYAGSTFTLGAPTVPNALTSGAVYTLGAPGNYSTVYLIGAATTGGQTSQPFTLTYGDAGNPVTQVVSMSSWAQAVGTYSGETVVATTNHKNLQNGTSVSGTYRLYGYQIPVDPTRTLVSVTVPNNRNVVIMALGFGTNTQAVVPGTYVYNPPAGTKLSVGTHPLNVTFTPTNPSGYTGATGATTITVTQATPILTWPTPAAIAVGTPLSGTQLNATASFQGASLPGTFTYTPPSGTVLTAGTHTLSVLFTPTDSLDFTTATTTVQIVVGSGSTGPGSTGVSGSSQYPSGDCCYFSQPTPYTITVSGSSIAPTGTVSVAFGGTTLATGTLVPGSNAVSTVNLSVPSSSLLPGANKVTITYSGDTNYVGNTNPGVINLLSPNYKGDPTSVGVSSVIYVPYTYTQPGTMTFNFNPGGLSPAPTEFTNNGVVCDPTQTPQPPTGSGVQGTTCVFAIGFNPALPGIRKGVVEIDYTPTAGVAEPKLYIFLTGLGSAPQIALSSANTLVLNKTLHQPQSLTFNPTDINNANLYVADGTYITNTPNLGQINKLTAGVLTSYIAASTNDLIYPSDVVFDAFDNLVVADSNAAKVVRFNPSLTETTVNTGTYTLGLPISARLDFGGNLYIADAGNTPRIVEVPGETYASYTPSLLNLGTASVTFPQALTVDNAGLDLYVADGGTYASPQTTSQVLQVALNGTGGTAINLSPCDATVTSCTLNSPAGLAFDPYGDLFITDSGARVLMVPAARLPGASPAAPNAPTTQLAMTGLVNPTGITLDGAGNVYVTDLNGTVSEMVANTGSLVFTSANPTLTTTVMNPGNLPLTISSVSLGAGSNSAFSITNNTCAAQLAAGASCTITITHSKPGGTDPDTLTITSNAFRSNKATITLTY